MKIKNALCGLLWGLLLLAAGTFTAQANPVIVSDFGATAPVLNPSTDTGYTPTVVNSEFDLRAAKTFGQSFKLPASGIVDKVYFNYRSFGLGDADGLVNFTFRLDVDMNGTYEIDQQFVGVNRVNFETSTASSWIEFDLSAANITLTAGTTHAVYWNSDNPSGWVAGVRYDNTPLANYADGNVLGNVISGASYDAWFAVTTVAVRDGGSTFALAGLSCFGLAGMNWFQRRRAASV